MRDQNICNKIMVKLIQNYSSIFEADTEKEDRTEERSALIIVKVLFYALRHQMSLTTTVWGSWSGECDPHVVLVECKHDVFFLVFFALVDDHLCQSLWRRDSLKKKKSYITSMPTTGLTIDFMSHHCRRIFSTGSCIDFLVFLVCWFSRPRLVVLHAAVSRPVASTAPQWIRACAFLKYRKFRMYCGLFFGY